MLQPGLHHKALLLATSLPLVALLAELNFRVLENPLRRRGAQIADRIRNSRSESFASAARKAV